VAEPAVVLLEAVCKSYNVGTPVETEVLHGIDLRLERGEFVAIMGPSGSGKSTLLNIIGLLDRPTRGGLSIDGHAASGLRDRDLTRLRGQTIGFVFQFHHLLPAFTALENVMMPILADRGRTDEAMRSRAEGLLQRVGLEDRARYRVTDLSGGQQQRVAIARALAMDPALVLADEPTGNLDTESGNQVFGLLREFNRERGTTFLVVTHDPRLADRCDRVIELVDGSIVGDRPRLRSTPVQ
jgi:lipoprotein-releasing system ATP-binding protein